EGVGQLRQREAARLLLLFLLLGLLLLGFPLLGPAAERGQQQRGGAGPGGPQQLTAAQHRHLSLSRSSLLGVPSTPARPRRGRDVQDTSVSPRVHNRTLKPDAAPTGSASSADAGAGPCARPWAGPSTLSRSAPAA